MLRYPWEAKLLIPLVKNEQYLFHKLNHFYTEVMISVPSPIIRLILSFHQTLSFYQIFYSAIVIGFCHRIKLISSFQFLSSYQVLSYPPPFLSTFYVIYSPRIYIFFTCFFHTTVSMLLTRSSPQNTNCLPQCYQGFFDLISG